MVSLWRFFKKFISSETVEGSIDTTDAVLGLAEKLQDKGQQIQQLAPYITQIDSLLDVLNSPLVQVVGAGLPFIPIATGVVRFCLQVAKKELTLAESVVLVCQVAYLESLKEILTLPVYQPVFETIKNKPVSEGVRKQLKKLGELEISEREAEDILIRCFHDSLIAKEFNQVLYNRLQEGIAEATARQITERVSRNTYRYINKAFKALSEAGGEIAALAQQYYDGYRQELEKIHSLDDYLAKIAQKPKETVFTEKFTYKQIYVPLKAKSVDSSSDIETDVDDFILQEWVADILQTSENANQVIFSLFKVGQEEEKASSVGCLPIGYCNTYTPFGHRFSFVCGTLQHLRKIFKRPYKMPYKQILLKMIVVG